jgi:hypothetical protein
MKKDSDEETMKMSKNAPAIRLDLSIKQMAKNAKKNAIASAAEICIMFSPLFSHVSFKQRLKVRAVYL